MFAAAVADLERQAARWGCEEAVGVAGPGRVDAEAGQGLVEELLLAGAQGVAADTPVEAVRGRLVERGDAAGGPVLLLRLQRWDQRPNALLRAGTRSVCSQVKVSAATSGSRPKWP